MKKIGTKRVCLFVLLLVAACSFTACGEKKQVISEDIQEVSQPYAELPFSDSLKFSYEDLTVNNLKMGQSIEEVEEILGKPVNMYNSNEIATGTDVLDEKIYAYNDLTLIFMPIDGSYKLCAAASVGNEDTFSRGIKVGDTKDKILENYYRDVNCLNNNLMTSDNATIIGKYLYGNYTIDKLDTQKEEGKVEYGVINYNGFTSFETADSYFIEFTYSEPPYKNGAANINDSFAQIAFDIDNSGIITGIRWYYYPQMEG